MGRANLYDTSIYNNNYNPYFGITKVPPSKNPYIPIQNITLDNIPPIQIPNDAFIKSTQSNIENINNTSNIQTYNTEEEFAPIKHALIGLPFMGIFLGTMQGIPWLWRNHGNYKESIKKAFENSKKATVRSIPLSYTDKIAKAVEHSVANIDHSNARKIRQLTQSARNATNFSDAYKNATQAEKLLRKTKLELNANNNSIFKKITTPFTQNPAAKWLGSTKVGAFLKRGGAPLMAALEGGIELFTEVIPAFKNKGLFAGLKQIGKSTCKVIASITGFAVGEAAGSAIGATIGGALGSLIPFIGTGIGASIGGFLGGTLTGLICSQTTTHITKKIIGKSEMEKFNKEQIQANTGVQNYNQITPQLATDLLNNAQNNYRQNIF